MPMTATQAQQLYVAYFNRPADTLGLAFWMTKDAASASASFAASTEYATTYAGMVIPPFLTGCGRRTHAAIFSFLAGVMPPIAIFGRSLL